MAGDCGVTGAGVCGRAGATLGAVGSMPDGAAVDPAAAGAVAVAAGGALFSGMNNGPFWPQPDNPADRAASSKTAGNNGVAPQITGGRYDANIGFTIRITV